MDSNYQKKYLKYKKKYIDFKGNMTGGTLPLSGASASSTVYYEQLTDLPEEMIEKILANLDLKTLQNLIKLGNKVLYRIALKYIKIKINEIEFDLEKIINNKRMQDPKIMQYLTRINTDEGYRRDLARRYEMKIDTFINKFNELVRTDPRASPKSLTQFFDGPDGGNVYKVILIIKKGNPQRIRDMYNGIEEIELANVGDFNQPLCSLSYDNNNSGSVVDYFDCSNPLPKERMKMYVNRIVDEFRYLTEISLSLMKYDFSTGPSFIENNPSSTTKIL
jgi:hypothetical protein